MISALFLLTILNDSKGELMFRRLFALALALAAINVSVAKAQSTNHNENRDADRADIRAEIEGITQAFVDGDIEKIHATHSEDWRGFLEGTQTPIKGLDEYMKANGITYPPPADYKKPATNTSNFGFKIFNFDVNFVSTDVGVANFMLDFGRKSGDEFTTTNRLRILDVFAKRDGRWIQVASHTVVDPTWRNERATTPANLPPQIRQQILNEREAVWRAWFANDRAKLEEMIPDEAVAIEAGSKDWQNRVAIFEGAKKFAESGARLTRLEFPRTEIQAYGNTIILFTSYLFEIEKDGQKSTSTGSGVETFVRRNGKFVNTGWLLASAK